MNGWKRAKADLINYQKEEVKRFEELIKFGNMDLIKDFIPVLDNFDLALTVLEKEGKAEKGIYPHTNQGSVQAPEQPEKSPFGVGVYMIRSQFEDILKKRGCEKIIVEPGGKFDPNIQEAIGEIESDKEAGTIALVVENGYTLNGRVVRPARVKLAKNKSN